MELLFIIISLVSSKKYNTKTMYALIALIIISLLMAIGFLILFIKSVKKDQFKDTYTPAVRILFDEVEDKNK